MRREMVERRLIECQYCSTALREILPKEKLPRARHTIFRDIILMEREIDELHKILGGVPGR